MVNNDTTTKYRSPTNGQAKRFNSRIVSRLYLYVSKRQTDRYTHLSPLTYAYSVQVHGYIKVSPFSQAITQTSPGTATIVPRRLSLATEDDATSPIYASMELIRRATILCTKAAKNLKLIEKYYKRHHDGPARFGTIFKEGDDTCLDRTSLFRPAGETFVADEYSKLLPKPQKPYKISDVNYNTLRNLQHGLEILSASIKLHCIQTQDATAKNTTGKNEAQQSKIRALKQTRKKPTKTPGTWVSWKNLLDTLAQVPG